MKKILVTGANGTIGRVLLSVGRLRGHKLLGLTRKVSDYAAVSLCQKIDEIKPNIIIHAAGSASVSSSVLDPKSDYQDSVVVFQNLLKGLKTSLRKPLLVYISSAAVYGNPAQLPVSEGDPCRPISPYGHHKLKCEELALSYSRKYNFPVLIVRLFSIFGPAQKKLIIWETYRQAKDANMIVITGTGEETRDYLSINTACEMIIDLAELQLEKGGTESIINVASGRSVRVKDLVSYIGNYTKCKERIKYRGAKRLGDPFKWQADISKLQSLLGKKRPEPGFKTQLLNTLKMWDREGKTAK